MKEIQLYPLKKNIFTQVDDDLFEYLNKWRWYVYSVGDAKYVKRVWHSIKGDGGLKTHLISMHRVIMNANDPKIQVDHIDRNPLNNQTCNLRFATASENMTNRRNVGGTSKYRGVCLNRRTIRGKTYSYWLSYISKDKKRCSIKRFPNTPCGELLAAVTYDIKAQELHGEFASLNFPIPANQNPCPVKG